MASGQPSSNDQSLVRYELTPVQGAFWFMNEMDQHGYGYNSNLLWTIRSDFFIESFKAAISALQQRHETWRSTFEVHNGKPYQVVHPEMPLPLDVVDASDWTDHQFENALAEEIYVPFDLSKEPSLHWRIFTRGDQDPVLSLRMHHIGSDGWSIMIMFKELQALYEAHQKGESLELDPIATNQNDFLDWQKKMLAGSKGRRQEKYWMEALAGDLPVLNLPLDAPHPPAPSYRCNEQRIRVEAGLTKRLKEQAQNLGTSLLTFYFSAFQTLMHRYSGQSEVITGMPSAGRKIKFKDWYGCFVNSIVIRSGFTENLTFAELIKKVETGIFNGSKNQDYPFPYLAGKLQQDRDASRAPVFQNMFVYENFNAFYTDDEKLLSLDDEGNECWHLGELKMERIPTVAQLEDFDMMFRLVEVDGSFEVCFEYNEDLFQPTSIERMARSFFTLLDAVAEDPNCPIAMLPVLSKQEKDLILDHWNDNHTDYSRELCSPHLIQAMAEAKADQIALHFKETSYTYAELNKKINRIANRLIQLGIGPDRLVGISLHRTPNLIAGVVAVLKAGGAYVPLDPNYPEERIEYITEEAAISVVITQKSLVNRYQDRNIEMIVVDDDADWADVSDANPEINVTQSHLSHVIYTSGSTGKPKGVAISHQCVAQLIDWVKNTYTEQELSGVLASTSLNFDLSVYEIVCTLALGGTIVLVENALYLPTDPARDKVRLINTVPSAIKELIRQKRIPTNVLVVNLAGEPLKEAVVQALYKLDHIEKVYNLYGPSEDTTYSTWALMGRDDDYTVMIGQPLSNTQAYILDPNLQICPIGVPGELYLGGDGLARGYLNRPDLTCERFVANPFHADKSNRIYRTGDLVRWWSNGEMECMGRIDHQVKIRGFRIELGEIETVIQKHQAVHECVVMDRIAKNDEKILVGYVTLNEGEVSNQQDLRNYVAEHLPEYMVPSFVVIMDEMPLNPNGKIDRKKLPDPNYEETVGEEIAESGPMDDLESKIAEVLAEILGIASVNANRKFFEMGLNSISATAFRLSLTEALGVDIPATAIFQHPSVKALAKFLQPSGKSQALTSRQATSKEGSGDIAVIAVNGRFPGAPDVDTFWQNLCDGVESISFFTEEELRASGVSEEDIADPNYVRAGAVIDDYDLFDADFFSMTPRESSATDPQHRLFLEASWELMERAGYVLEDYDGRVGVFAGCSANTYYVNNLVTNKKITDLVGFYGMMIGNEKDFLPTRVAFKLNLKGPAVLVQTACSTSLVAIHLACRNILDGECDMAIAGGVAVQVPMKKGYMYTEGGTLTPDGHVRPFDKDAAGMLAGNGLGLVLLKRLEDAVADGDHIVAVVKATAINNDGADKVGYTAPSVTGQATVIADALNIGNVDPNTISYVEAHGTGTNLGDPIEIAGLTQAYQVSTDRKQYCAIGSVKANIGHLDAAAGVSGFIKAIMALKNAKIPPSLNFNEANPDIDFANTPFFVNTELRDWNTDSGTRRAAISSFGMGGTNVHAIMEEAPKHKKSSSGSKPYVLVPLAARDDEALQQMRANLKQHIENHPDVPLADLAYTLQIGRKAFAKRGYCVASSIEELSTALSNDAGKLWTTAEAQEDPPNVVFLFSGQGSQYIDMALDLYTSEPSFKATVDECADKLKKHLPLDLREVLFPSIENPKALTDEERKKLSNQINQTSMAQPALFVIEYAMAKFWMDMGITPSAMIGHSIGEYPAATLAGVLKLDDALELVALRGKLMQAQPPGSMMAIPVEEDVLSKYLGDGVDLAAVNAPGRCVVAGPDEALKRLEERLEADGLPCSWLHTSHAFHSSMMDDILEPFTAQVANFKLSPPKIPYLSNLTGTWITDEEATDPSYYAKHLRGTVRFAKGFSELLDDNPTVFIEVGPGRTLVTFAKRQIGKNQPHFPLTSIRHPKDQTNDLLHFYRTVGQFWALGNSFDWHALHDGEKRHRVIAPTYPFQRKRHWIEPLAVAPTAPAIAAAAVPTAEAASSSKMQRHALRKETDLNNWFYLPLWKQTPSAAEFSGATGQRWMLFLDECGLGHRLSEELRRHQSDVILVEKGEYYSKRTQHHFMINPGSAGDYQKMFADLKSQHRLPNQVVHLGLVTTPQFFSQRVEFSDYCIQNGYLSLILLVQAFDQVSGNADLEISVISNDMQEVNEGDLNHPEKATALGAVKVIPREYPNILCRSIDIQLPNTQNRSSMMVAFLLGEIASTASESSVAYRGKRRWVQTFEPVNLNVAKTAHRLKQGGTYLILGGLGKIGMVLTEFLADTYQANIILTRRTPIPSRDQWDKWLASHDASDPTYEIIQRLKTLSGKGAKIQVASADITDVAQMESVLADIKKDFGGLDGVIHAADLPPSGLIKDLTPEKAIATLASKVKGTLVLESLLERLELDFLALFSSTSSILGNMGYSDYCAGNAFLDAFAHYRNSRYEFETVSINWDGWNLGDMNFNESVLEQKSKQLGFGDALIQVDEGVQCFKSIMESDWFSQIVVSQWNLQHELEDIRKLEQHISRPATSTATDSQAPIAKPTPQPAPAEPDTVVEKPTQAQTTPPAAPAPMPEPIVEEEASKTEVTVAEFWSESLGIDDLDVNEDFIALGGDSLMATMLASRLRRHFKTKISPSLFTEAPTVAAMADKIDELLGIKKPKAETKPAETEAPKPSAEQVESAFRLRTSKAPFVAPSSEIETKLATMWRDLLMVEPIGTADDFIESGGSTDKAKTLSSQISETFGVEIPPHEITNNATVQSLAERIDTLKWLILSNEEPSQDDDQDEEDIVL